MEVAARLRFLEVTKVFVIKNAAFKAEARCPPTAPAASYDKGEVGVRCGATNGPHSCEAVKVER